MYSYIRILNCNQSLEVHYNGVLSRIHLVALVLCTSRTMLGYSFIYDVVPQLGDRLRHASIYPYGILSAEIILVSSHLLAQLNPQSCLSDGYTCQKIYNKQDKTVNMASDGNKQVKSKCSDLDLQ